MLVGSIGARAAWAMNREYLPGIQWQEPPVVTPGENGSPPSDAIVLFDGTDMSAWENGENWPVEDGVVTEGRGDIRTKQHFGDCQLHIEWSAPVPARGEGQGRGNSGVFFDDQYEVQVLDSYQNETYFEGQAGAVYKQTPPLVNAMRPPGEWNVYDIIWTAPRFNDDGSLKSPAYVTALHNGVLILNHFKLLGDTFWPTVPKYEAHEPGPIKLQDHGNPVRFRNIWVREIKPLTSERTHEPYYHDHDSGKEWLVSEGETPPE
jgi:3-keto-disaccharide hydrolase